MKTMAVVYSIFVEATLYIIRRLDSKNDSQICLPPEEINTPICMIFCHPTIYVEFNIASDLVPIDDSMV